MLKRLSNWLDERTGYRAFVRAMLLEHVPGGAKWRYVWGSCLAFVFMIQLVTGILLMTAYSPSDTTAWGSVHYIQYQMDFGWLIRGIHHFGSQTMVVLMALHMLQVVISGAHLAPREINWWLGLALMGVILALSLTGYLLPWDQKGYYATQVATNIAGNTPVIGTFMQKVIVGGTEYGNQTLTRFFALHVGILPPLVVVLVVLHIYVFRRHGVKHVENPKGEGWFWPDQAFRDLLVCLVIFGVMVGLVVFGGHGQKLDDGPNNQFTNPASSTYEKWAHAGQGGLGANLDAPADRNAEGYPARPEWYFLFLFQLLKYFPGELELIGTLIIPNGVMILLFLLPLFGYGRMRKFGHAFGIVVVSTVLIGAGVLTFLAWQEDYSNTDKAVDFQKKLAKASEEAHRAVNLGMSGIPASGSVEILRKDPMTQGPKLFQTNCASCHKYNNEFRTGENPSPATASDLKGFGSEEWISRMLNNPGHEDFFGKTDLDTMSGYIENSYDLANMNDKDFEQYVADEPDAEEKKNLQQRRKQQKADLQLLAQWLASHPGRASADAKNADWYKAGQALFDRKCQRCHGLEGKEPRSERSAGPDLTGYGDQEWIRKMIMSPHAANRYGLDNTMPAFRPLEGPTGELTLQDWETQRALLRAKHIAEDDDEDDKKEKQQQIANATKLIHLSDIERELIIRWLTGDGRIVFGGEIISGPPREK